MEKVKTRRIIYDIPSGTCRIVTEEMELRISPTYDYILEQKVKPAPDLPEVVIYSTIITLPRELTYEEISDLEAKTGMEVRKRE